MAEQYERLKQLRDTDLENAQLYQDAMTALEIQAQENRENLLAESYQRVGEQAAALLLDRIQQKEKYENYKQKVISTDLKIRESTEKTE